MQVQHKWGRQSCTHFAPVDQVPKYLQAKQLTPINNSCFRKRNIFLLRNSYHNLCMHTYDIILMKIITCVKGQASPTLKGLKNETGTFTWNNLLTY